MEALNQRIIDAEGDVRHMMDMIERLMPEAEALDAKLQKKQAEMREREEKGLEVRKLDEIIEQKLEKKLDELVTQIEGIESRKSKTEKLIKELEQQKEELERKEAQRKMLLASYEAHLEEEKKLEPPKNVEVLALLKSLNPVLSKAKVETVGEIPFKRRALIRKEQRELQAEIKAEKPVVRKIKKEF